MLGEQAENSIPKPDLKLSALESVSRAKGTFPILLYGNINSVGYWKYKRQKKAQIWCSVPENAARDKIARIPVIRV
jgi:hypothetical protein